MKLLWRVTNRSHREKKKAADRAPGAKDNSLFIQRYKPFGNWKLLAPSSEKVSTARLTRPTRSQAATAAVMDVDGYSGKAIL